MSRLAAYSIIANRSQPGSKYCPTVCPRRSQGLPQPAICRRTLASCPQSRGFGRQLVAQSDRRRDEPSRGILREHPHVRDDIQLFFTRDSQGRDANVRVAVFKGQLDVLPFAAFDPGEQVKSAGAIMNVRAAPKFQQIFLRRALKLVNGCPGEEPSREVRRLKRSDAIVRFGEVILGNIRLLALWRDAVDTPVIVSSF